jgi:cell migration-inducing and hyaluronan-binding protein
MRRSVRVSSASAVCVAARPRQLQALLIGLALAIGATGTSWAETVVCNDGDLPEQAIVAAGAKAAQQPDLRVTGHCTVGKALAYYYGKVNITDGGELAFTEPATGNADIAFWASSIIIENGGSLTAGAGTRAYGDPAARTDDKQSGTLSFYIYGSDSFAFSRAENRITQENAGASCASPGAAPCGIPTEVWNDNGASLFKGCSTAHVAADSNCLPGLPATSSDFFYQYGPLYGDGAKGLDGNFGYFGAKTFAVSFGGTLVLNGYKGASSAAIDATPTDSGISWVRLAADLEAGKAGLTLAKAPGDRWQKDDRIVVTTTDYLPGHSEELTIKAVDGNTVTVTTDAMWFHRGTRYPIDLGEAKERLLASGMDPTLVSEGAETRAAVALLTRSIRIVSAGDKPGQSFTDMPQTYAYGAQFIVRQGVKEVHVQGVEFDDMGVGGRMGHYTVHFHEARMLPPNTYVKDSSFNVSNSRWVALHSTQNLTLQRNVGWQSIGHGFYLEDGTETDNRFYSDIGIFARAAIDNAQNPREIPGILADSQSPYAPEFTGGNLANPGFPYRSDAEYPAVFWITNGWNEFVGDMAAGAGACGSGFWFVPVRNTDAPDVVTDKNTAAGGHMKWAFDSDGRFGYAGLQGISNDFEGSTPLEAFYMDYATTAMFSFQTTTDAPSCNDTGFLPADASTYPPPLSLPRAFEIASVAPKPVRTTDPAGHTAPDLAMDPYYPHTIGLRLATRCPLYKEAAAGMPPLYNCSNVGRTTGDLHVCADGPSADTACAVTVLDHYTTSFTWASGNVSAVWLRPQWYLLANSVLTDPQNGELTFVTGGDFTHASVISGYWAVARNSIFVGHTQTQDSTHKFALDSGPFNALSELKCDPLTTSGAVPGYCLSTPEGVGLPVVNFFVNQRLQNIYDGPAYDDSNAYLDITTSKCPRGAYNGECMYGTGLALGIPNRNPGTEGADQDCYLPNAAIAWKQPNGFFYPPAFHSDNLYFHNVDIRHYVIDPLFQPTQGVTAGGEFDFGQGGSYVTDAKAAATDYCTQNEGMFIGFTTIDRQTELNDDDGTLTGLSNDWSHPSVPPDVLVQTISVNDDNFFTAPIEAPECASAVGANAEPQNACSPAAPAAPPVTARTSPYDYVATVVYHQPGNAWSSVCSNDTCYGVPLYRQELTGNDGSNSQPATREWQQWIANGCASNQDTPQCRWPFIRMAGENISTRETLTVNNGVYYLDTTVPLDMQKSEKYNGTATSPVVDSLVNVFEAGETYTVFFLYGKTYTHQTYQIYVGKDPANGKITQARIFIDTASFRTDQGASVDCDTVGWLKVDCSQVASSGIVTVTVDLSGRDDLNPATSSATCKPATFCGRDPQTQACVATIAKGDPLLVADKDFGVQADKACGQWAIKDLDCPPGGCYGFQFTLPAATIFTADATIDKPSPHRPAPVPFPATAPGAPDWSVLFKNTTHPPDNTQGQCFYPKLPGTDCAVP